MNYKRLKYESRDWLYIKLGHLFLTGRGNSVPAAFIQHQLRIRERES